MPDHRTEANEAALAQTEQAAFPALAIVDLNREGASVQQDYKNFVALKVNDHCVRLAVMQGEYPWHQHPRSDECFLVLDGELEIDLAEGQTFRLKPGEAFTVPAGVVHRTRACTRAVNLCFEDRNAYADVVFVDK